MAAFPIMNAPAASMTKNQKRKEKKKLKEERQQRAQAMAEKRKQDSERIVSTSKSSESSPPSEQTSSVIATNEPNPSAHVPNNTSSPSDSDSSDTAADSPTGFQLVPLDEGLQSRAKKIRKHQRQQNKLNLGVGIVETEKPPAFRKQQPSKKKRRQLTKKDKVKHNSINPAANLILKHQDDSPALKEAAKRVAEQQAQRAAQNPRRRGNGLPSISFGSNPMQLTRAERDELSRRQQATFKEMQLKQMELDEILESTFSLFISAISQHVQDESSGDDNMSDRCYTVYSDSDNEDAPNIAISPDDEDVLELADGSDDVDMPDFVADSMSLGSEDVALPPGVGGSDGNLDEVGSLSNLLDLADQINELLASEDSIIANDTAIPDDAAVVDHTITPGRVTPHDNDNLDNAVSPNAITSPAEYTLPDDPVCSVCTIKAVSTTVEAASHPPPDDVAVSSIERDFASTMIELPGNDSAPSWVSSMLSLPNAAQYPLVLSVDQELALVAIHITPLSFPKSKQKGPKAIKSTKVSSEPSSPNKPATQSPPADPATTLKPAEIEEAFDNRSTQVGNDMIMDLADQSPRTTEKASVDNAMEISDLGQSAAVCEQHEALVRLHVPPLEFSTPESKLPEELSKESIQHITSVEDETAVEPLSPVKTSTINNAASLEHTIVEGDMAIGNPMIHKNPLALRSKSRPDCEQVLEVKIAEQDSCIASSSSPKSSKLPNTVHRIPPLSLLSESSKASSRQPSVRLDMTDDLERKMYKARNTYLGIISLEDFLVKLDFDEDTGTTTKTAICKTFTFLSVEEAEVIYGQRATPFSPNVPNAYAQRRIKLGSITLSAFLQGIIFDGEGVTHIKRVMRSFQALAPRDMQQLSKLGAAFFFLSSSSADSSPVASPLPSPRLGSERRSPSLALDQE